MQSSTNSILIGGLAGAVLSTVIQVLGSATNAAGTNPVLGIVFGCLGCLVGLTSGFIAVWHYTGEHELTLSRGKGVKLGALAGVVSALAGFLLVRALISIDVMPSAEDVINQMMDNPAVQGAEAGMDMAVRWTEFAMGWGGLIIGLIIGPLLGLLGGMIGAAMFKRGDSEGPGDSLVAE